MPSLVTSRAGAARLDLARWSVSVIGVVALLAGLPVALVAGHLIPPVDQVGHLLTHPGSLPHDLDAPFSDAVVEKALVAAAWVMWLWLAACIMTEVAAAFRGGPALRLPVSRYLQSVASTLVGASLAIVPLGRDGLPMRFVADAAVVQRVPALALPAEGLLAGPSLAGPVLGGGDRVARPPAVVFADATVPAPARSTYVVQPGDSLWSIAGRQLGSPLKWSEIAQLNYGRIQPDGRQLTDAHWIFPGWELVLPVSPSAAVSPSPPSLSSVSSLSSLASASPGSVEQSVVVPTPSVPATAPVPVPAPAPVSPAHRTSMRVDPGRVTGGSPPAETHGGDADHTDRALPRAEGATNARHRRSDVPRELLAYGILGAGVVALLDRLRRAQRRHRPHGLRIALPDGDLAILERHLRVAADGDGAEWIDLGLRALVASSLRSEMMPPRVAVARLRADALEITVDSDAVGVPPPPFTATSGTGVWLLIRDQFTLEALRADSTIRDADAPFPALVSLGDDPNGLVLIDVEQAASLALSGPHADRMLETIAVELGTAPWSDQVEIIVVGSDWPLDSLDRVSQVASLDEVLPRIQRRVRERTALLASVGRQANWEIRWLEGGDAWDLCVVLCPAAAVDADEAGAVALVELAGEGGAGVAVVLGAATTTAHWRLHVGETGIELNADGRRTDCARTPHVADHLAADVGSLVRIAGQRDGVASSAAPYDLLAETDAPFVPPASALTAAWEPERGHERPAVPARVDESNGAEDLQPKDRADFENKSRPPGEPRPQPASEVEVRVLGPVEVLGAARLFTRAWALELVVYLAFHPRGASSEQWATALWPDRIMAPASLHSTASAARRSLGVTASGEDHLPRAHGRLALAATVGSDWSRFLHLAQRSDSESWRDALSLIRGRPFEGLRAPDWVLLEGIGANVEAVVVDLASRYAEHCLGVAEPAEAEWAARQGLRVSAYDERLYRLLMRAADAAGNPAGVESVMHELVRLVAEDVEPYDAVHPETLELYRTLSRRPTAFLPR